MEKEKRGNKKKGGKMVLAAGQPASDFWRRQAAFSSGRKCNADAAEGAVVIEAGENGEIIYAQIDNIVGNDIDVSIMAETASGSGNTGQNVSGQNAVESGNAGQKISGQENVAWDMPDGMTQGMPADMSDGTPQGMPGGYPADGAGGMGNGGDEGGNSTRNSTKDSTGNNAGKRIRFYGYR